MSVNKYIFNLMKKYRFISPMKEKELEAKAAIYRKKWKGKMFLQSGSYFDNQNPKCGWGDGPVINMPQSKEDVKKYFLEYEKQESENNFDWWECNKLKESKTHQEICQLPENVQIYIAGLHNAIESNTLMPYEDIVSEYFYTQHEWDLFLILVMLQKTSGIYGNDEGPWPLYWFGSRELLLEALHLYPDLIKNTNHRSLPLKNWHQKDFVKEVVEVNYELFKAAPKKVKESKESVLEAAKVDGRVIRYIKTALRNDPEVALNAIKSHADAENYLFKKTLIKLNLTPS